MNEYGKYWLIPTDDRLFKSLCDINADMSFILGMRKLKDFLRVISPDGYIYVGMIHDIWDYNVTNNVYDYNKAYNRCKHQYMGRVNISDIEFNVKKYNI